jgi:hypothetical protein
MHGSAPGFELKFYVYNSSFHHYGDPSIVGAPDSSGMQHATNNRVIIAISHSSSN